jgi:hypothetical protein
MTKATPIVRTVALAALFATCTAGVARADDHLWSKMGATQAAEDADWAACRQDSKTVPVHMNGAVGVSTSPAGAIGGLIALAIIEGVKKAQAEAAFDRHCMKRHGWVWLPLTPEEQAALGRQKTPTDKAAWVDTFYAGDIGARLDEAARPKAPVLPTAQDEPMTLGALRFDPDVLTATAGPVSAGQTVLAGKIRHRRTATLNKSVDVSGVMKLHADAGTVFEALVIPTDFEPAQTYWCGPMRAKPALSPARVTDDCVTLEDTGYVVLPAQGESWLADPPDPASALKWKTTAVDFSMTESDQDLIGPMDLTLTVTKITAKAISLEAKAGRDGKTVIVWSGALAVEADGMAVLPFWSHRLVLTRAGKTVTAAYTPDGDGAGWLEAKLTS